MNDPDGQVFHASGRSLNSPNPSNLRHPIHEGYVFKKGVVLGCIPMWKRRLLVLKGGYLFKFEDSKSSSPQGAPIPLYEAQFELLDDPVQEASECAFRIVTVYKEYLLKADTREEAKQWIDFLQQAKHESIRQQLGHAVETEDDVYARKAGELLCRHKVKRLERESQQDYVPSI